MINSDFTNPTAYQPSRNGQSLAVAIVTAIRPPAPFAGGHVS